ncbi:hypothetical protein Tco_0764222 [Tanacetum coccineum]
MLSDFAGEVWEQNRVLAGFGIGGKIGKGCSKNYSGCLSTSILQTPTVTTTTADTTPIPTNSYSQATNFPNTSQDVDELETQQQPVHHQPATIADNVPNTMFDENAVVNPFATSSTSVAESSSS